MENGEENKQKWEDIWGETEIEFGPDGKPKITDRKTGEITKPEQLEKVESFYEKLNDSEKITVDAEMEKFEEEARKYMSPNQFNEARDKKMEELSKKQIKLRI